MYTLLILNPLLGSLLFRTPKLIVSLSFFNFLLFLLIFFEIAFSHSFLTISFFPWFNLPSFSLHWSFTFDALTLSKLFPIILISFLIQLYSLSYMHSDPHLNRFLCLLSLFSFAMILIVTAGNFLILLLGYELVGIISFLLIGFYLTKIDANLASINALFLNKFGDLGFILALIIFFSSLNSFSIEILASLSPSLHSHLFSFLGLAFLLAAMAKSAFFGIHTWLIKAMQGPTPVSALLHSSTKITAGVFILLRLSPFFSFSDDLLFLILLLGSFGCLFGASAGLMENDFKGIIAYSTMSQLGYMIVAIGISHFHLAIFHLILHAFFKSLLFLTSGAILHSLFDQQDIRFMGSFVITQPFFYLVFFFASLSLMAFPFTAGFYSKDLLLSLLSIPYNFTYSFAYLLCLLSAFFTCLYSIRSLIFIFFSRPNYSIIDSSFNFTLLIPLLILSFFAIFLGYLSHNLFLNPSYFANSLLFLNSNAYFPFYLSNLIFIPISFFFLFFLLFNCTNLIIPLLNISYYSSLFSFLNLFNYFNRTIIINYFHSSFQLSRTIDRSLSLSSFFNYLGFLIELLSTGLVIDYLIILIFSIILILILIF